MSQNKDWRIQVAETRAVYSEKSTGKPENKEEHSVGQGSQVSGDGVQKTAGLRTRGPRKQEWTEFADQDTADTARIL